MKNTKSLSIVWLVCFLFCLQLSSVFAQTLLSTDVNNKALNGMSHRFELSQDFKTLYIENDSLDSRLNQTQILAKNLESGAVTPVSTNKNQQLGNEASYNIHLSSSDPNKIVFESTAKNLIDTRALSDALLEPRGQQIYFKNLRTGNVTLISASSEGIPGNYFSHFPQISTDASKVYFQSNSSNLIPNGDRVYRIYVKNLKTGKIKNFSVNLAGVNINSASLKPKLTTAEDALFFESAATNLISEIKGYQIYRKRLDGKNIEIISLNSEQIEANKPSSQAHDSYSGNEVVFISDATNLAENSSGMQVYLRDRLNKKTFLISSNARGIPGAGYSFSPQISPDAQNIIFISSSKNLSENIPGSKFQVFVKNRTTGKLLNLSLQMKNPPIKLKNFIRVNWQTKSIYFIAEDKQGLDQTYFASGLSW